MTSYMRKCISMGVYDPADIRQNFAYWHQDFTETGTTYVRFFIKWDKIAPYGPNNPATDPAPLRPGVSTTIRQYVEGLDFQIAVARAIGLKVVLVFESFPQWATGSSDPRIPPADLSPTSPWSLYLNWIYLRWNPLSSTAAATGAWADIIEICNEPNGYRDFRGLPPHYIAGNMMMTAQRLQDLTPLPAPIFAGPALADNSSVEDFQDKLLAYLRFNGFRAATTAGNPKFAWTHHCYRDIEGNQGNMVITRAQRDRLRAFGWRGWPFADPNDPYLLLTEGGARLANVPSPDQVPRTVNGYNNVHNDLSSGGRGIAMFTNYLDVTDPQTSGNCGLRCYADPYAALPLFAAWKALVAP